MRNAACDIDPLLSVEIEPVPNNDGVVLSLIITCNHNPEGIEAVQDFVAWAPPMPPRLQACAFTPPLPKETARELDSLELLGREVPLQKVRFLAEPSNTAPGTFDIVGFVPPSGITGMDPEEVPGTVVANVVLSMGIGELRVMTRIRSIGIAVTEKPPADAVAAWDLLEIIDRAPTH